ncbi:hypothetical protein ACFYUD_34075 [Nocardia tengchongensis]|uniref:hypothetical protein n=1 Tax=Nocardia tengchongensis TaxID=2055889 RepID=UPI0036C9694B
MDWERRQELREMGYDSDDLSVQLDVAWIRYLIWQQVRDGADPRMLGDQVGRIADIPCQSRFHAAGGANTT